MPQHFHIHPHTELPWMEPLEATARYTRPSDRFVLLHASDNAHPRGRFSLLALLPHSISTPATLAEMAEQWQQARTEGFTPAALLGWMGYEAWQHLPQFAPMPPAPQPSYCPLPPSWWMQPQSLLVFDHVQRRLHAHGILPAALEVSAWPAQTPPPPLEHIGSSASRMGYMQQVEQIREAIARGDYYQANLTRKFFGQLRSAPSPLPLFARLCAISPAPYAALVHTPEWSVLSASMEEFIGTDPDGSTRAFPIKGSASRLSDATADAHSAATLQASPKDRAENTMIVDLMRHDIAQHCVPGSVQVPRLCGLESFAQVHHLVSEVLGQRAPESTPAMLLADAFPPASMTGAPKHAVLHALAALEPMPRGVYSGMLGWLGQEPCADMSVVIRTLVLQGRRFEFQVGGGIVSDSTPESEWRETLIKARGIARLLAIPMDLLEDL